MTDEELKREHGRLDDHLIRICRAGPGRDDPETKRLKQRKLRLKDEIRLRERRSSLVAAQ